ncbi:hypothetical protein C3495_03870 [Clostridiaceae bacterium 14S0207]|nr:hypothetical protein C3495_03870 [Clostridiaceae bacterium 14S0207]
MLIKNVDPKEIDSILEKLNLNKDSNLQKENNKNEVKEAADSINSSKIINEYEDSSTIEIAEKPYEASLILNIVDSLLKQEDTEFLDKVIAIYKDEDYEEECESIDAEEVSMEEENMPVDIDDIALEAEEVHIMLADEDDKITSLQEKGEKL